MFGDHMYLEVKEYERLRFPLTFEKWFELNMRSQGKGIINLLHYDKVIEYYSRYFSKVHILLFEEFVTKQEAFVDRLCEILSTDSEEALLILRGKH